MFGNVFVKKVTQMQIRDRAYRHIAMQCVGDHCLVSSPGGPGELKTLKAQNALQVFRKKLLFKQMTFTRANTFLVFT